MSDRLTKLRPELAALEQQARQQQASGQTGQARATKQAALSKLKDALERR